MVQTYEFTLSLHSAFTYVYIFCMCKLRWKKGKARQGLRSPPASSRTSPASTYRRAVHWALADRDRCDASFDATSVFQIGTPKGPHSWTSHLGIALKNTILVQLFSDLFASDRIPATETKSSQRLFVGSANVWGSRLGFQLPTWVKHALISWETLGNCVWREFNISWSRTPSASQVKALQVSPVDGAAHELCWLVCPAV